MPETRTKLCKDCRWAVNLVAGGTGAIPLSMYYQCHHPSSRVTSPPDLVTGQPGKDEWEFCSSARSSGYENLCGREGRFWEPIVVGFGEAITDNE